MEDEVIKDDFSETAEEKEPKQESDKKDKKTKNLISLVILLAGLLVGSLFVDLNQLVRGNGYSQKNLSKSDIFEANGRTWVAYQEPAVSVSIINDDACEKCDVSDVLVWLKRVAPTISTEKINFDSEAGAKFISDFQIKTLPAFIFGQEINKTELYSQAKELFVPVNDKYVLNAQALGIPAGKYLSAPSLDEKDATFGKTDSNVKVVIFSDFQCPYCKLFHAALRETMKKYSDKVAFIFKEFPISEIHAQANEAALAAECALEQNKFLEYADVLFGKQAEWGNTGSTLKFKEYSRALSLKTADFNLCLDGKKYQSKIDTDKKEAEQFGITGTPTVFVNDQAESGAITLEQLKSMIDAELNK